MTQQIQFLSDVGQIMETDFQWVLDDEPISYARDLLDRSGGGLVAVVDQQHRFIGTVSASDAHNDDSWTTGQVACKARMTASPDDSAFDVVSRMLAKGLDWVPVVENRRLVGGLSRDCVLAAYGETRHV